MSKSTSFALVTTVLAAQVVAADSQDWNFRLDLQGSYLPYSGSEFRDDLWNVGLFLTGEYRTGFGFTLGYNRDTLRYKHGIKNIEQNTFFGSVRRYIHSKPFPGTLTLRFDGYYIGNDDPTGLSDEGGIVAPMISYLTPDKNYYVDLGYTHSSYKKGPNLHQITPTFGMAMRGQYDWLQFRGYFVVSSNEARSQGRGTTAALEVKWYHYFKPGNFLRLHRIQITGIGGTRFFAVDPDTAVVYNLADVQEGGVSIGGLWKIGSGFHVQLFGGANWFKHRDLNDNYTAPYVYLNVGKRW